MGSVAAGRNVAAGRSVRAVAIPALLFVLIPALLFTVVVACGGSGVVPRAGLSFGAVPNLQGQEVMVLPVQIREAVPAAADPDAELGYALGQRGPSIQWLLPDTLRRITARNPGIDAPLEGLAVGIFLQTQVERVGDPLFGQLRRINGLVGAPLALIPVRLRYRARPDTVEGRVLEPAMELAAALLHVRSGRVLWFGIVDGATGGADDPRTLASAADALARVVAR